MKYLAHMGGYIDSGDSHNKSVEEQVHSTGDRRGMEGMGRGRGA
jgi:hypothetical protein